MMNKNAITPEQILESHDTHIRQLAEQLREIIKRNIPQVVEKAYPGWRAIGYRHPKAGYICGIFPYLDKINLAFEHGASFHDPDRVLKNPPTSSKQVRYLEIKQIEDINEAVIEDFIAQAIFIRGK